ncbi:MAG: protein rep [Acidiferrobacteraceae bacterium]
MPGPWRLRRPWRWPSGRRLPTCGDHRLCPHEQHRDALAWARRYRPALTAWLQARRGRRIQFITFTQPSTPPGTLKEAWRGLLHDVTVLLRSEVCAAVSGALVVGEITYSPTHGWHPHAHVLVALETGRFLNWKRLRAAWFTRARRRFPGYEGPSFSVDMQKITTVLGALHEIIKYVTKHTSAADEDGTGLTAWPATAFTEWRAALKGTRRLRAYGCLYGQKLEALVVAVPWCGSDAQKNSDSVTEADTVRWYGAIAWDHRRKDYSVRLRAPRDDFGSLVLI